MSTEPKLSFLERAVASLMETMSQRMAGFSPPFIREVVHAYGIRGAFRRLSLLALFCLFAPIALSIAPQAKTPQRIYFSGV